MKIKILSTILEKHKTHPLLIQSIAVFSFFLSFFLNSPLLNTVLEFKPKINDFSNHIVSSAALNNFDVEGRVKGYYFCLISLFLLAAFLFLLIFNFVKNKFDTPDSDKKNLEIVQQVSFIGIASLLASIFLVKIDLACVLLLFIGFYLLFTTNKESNFRFDNALWILITALPLTFVIHLILKKNHPFSFLPEYFSYNDIKFPLAVDGLLYFFFFTIIAIILHFLLKNWTKESAISSVEMDQLHKRIYLASIPISLTIIVLSVFLEFFNVINLRFGFVFDSPTALFVMLMVMAIGLSFVYYKILKKKEQTKSIDYNPIKKYLIPLLVLSLGFMIAQPWRMIGPENEFFEFANHGLSVDHFFRYGKIPVLETFDAHMLSNEIFAYAYGFINGYEPWAPFLYNSYIFIFIYFLVFVLLKRIIGARTAFLVLLCFPMLSVITSNFIYVGIVALSLLNLFYKKEKKQFYWFWGAIILMCLFRLDLGFAAAVAGIISYFLIHFISRKPYYIKPFLITGLISAAVVGGLFLILSLIKGINPIHRLIEFLNVAMSNQNWAYVDMGDQNHIVFRIMYYIAPVVVLLLFAKIVLQSIVYKSVFEKIANNKKQLAALVFFIFFTLIFYFNLPRGIVRHNFLFNNIMTTVSTIPLAIACYIFIFKRKYNLVYFLSVSILLFLLFNLTATTFLNKDDSYFAKAFSSPSFKEKFQPAASFNKTRVREVFSFADIRYFKEVLDKVLLPDETYFDFSSTNYYYALVERKNPLYVNQSPLLLNGDKSQDFALKQILDAKTPLVLMPNKDNIWYQIDGVAVEYKYFKIAEFIYKNYTPLLKMNGFTIYVLKDKKASFLKKLENSKENQLLISDFSNLIGNQIQPNNTIVELNEKKELVLTKNGEDAFISGLLQPQASENANEKDSPRTIKIKLEALATGSVQIFYWLKGEGSFSEANSKVFQVPAIGPYEFEMNTTAIQDIRIDLDLPKIILKEISVGNQKLQFGSNKESDSYNLGEIPMVWGTLSDQKLFSSVKNLKEEINQNSVLLPLNLGKNIKPSYLFIEMESDTIQAATTQLFDKKNNKVVDYLFKVNAGKNKYAIRLSSNYHWWNNTITKVNLFTEHAVKISKFALISEDGKNQIDLKENEFYLSNINDENWSGGVGIPYNILLMDNAPRTLKALQNGKNLELNDGSVLKISKFTVVGNYIHVEVQEPLNSIRSTIEYPNNFKIIK